MEIQLVDLKNQYLKIASEIKEGLEDVMLTSHFIKGPYGKRLEQELSNYLNATHTVNCANGTDALQIALMALNLQPGDEVITPAFTYAATVEVAKLLHLKPVYVDVDSDTFCIDVTQLEHAITPKTKAIIPVHLFGQCANMEAILKVAQEKGIFVIEDTAQAIGGTYTFSDGAQKKSGTE